MDRIKFLNDLLTIEIRQDMKISYGALLSPQGKIIADIFIHDTQNTCLLDLPADQYAQIMARLNMYKLRAQVEISESDIVVGQSMAGKLDPRSSQLGSRVYGDIGDMTHDEYLKRRIQNRIPEFGIDFDSNDAYPVEWRFKAINGIDFTKGCYVGQEIAARMRHKTELKKSIFRVKVTGDVQLGDEIYFENKPAGKLLSHRENEALAFLRTRYTSEELKTSSAVLKIQD